MNNIPTFQDFLLEKKTEKVFVFDFDDTLGVTENPTGILHLIDGEPIEDIENFLLDYGVPKKEIMYTAPSKKYIGGEIAYITSHGYKLYGNHAKKLRDAGKLTIHYGGEDQPLFKGSESIIDFSPSSNIDLHSTKPIKSIIDVMKDAENNGHEIGVITARKGKTPMKSIDGDLVSTTNAKDIVRFLHKYGIKTITLDDVYGAADFNTNIPITKATIIVQNFIDKYNANQVNFYDDDPKNTNAVDSLCGKVDATIQTYNDDFAKGAKPKNPSNICGGRKRNITTENKIYNMKNLPTFKEFLNEGKISDKIIELAEELEKILSKKQILFSKELDDYAKDLFSKIDLKFYFDYREEIINLIKDNNPSIEIND